MPSDHTPSRRHQPRKPKPSKGRQATEQIVNLHGVMAHGGRDYAWGFSPCLCDRTAIVVCKDCDIILAAFADRSDPCEHLLSLEADGINLTWSTEKIR